MVLGLLTLAAIPTTIGTAEAIKQSTRAKLEAKRDAKFTLEVYCDANSRKRDQVHGKQIVLRNNKVCTLLPPFPDVKSLRPTCPQLKLHIGTSKDGYPFEGFYIHYPNDDKPLGLVSMVSDDPPMMNWIYADKNTLELKYGNRTASIEHVVGPWDWAEDEVGLTLEGAERLVAVEERKDVWAVYYDRNDDGKGLPQGKRVLDISLDRKLVAKG